jgi:hypothetical protein
LLTLLPFVQFLSLHSKGSTMRVPLLIAFCLCSMPHIGAAAQDWPQFRGAGGDGQAADAKHPEHWSADEHVAWKAKLAGVGWSQPIVWKDKVFVTTAVADKQQRPKPGDWSPGDGLGGLSAFLGNLRSPPKVDYRWQLICLNAADGKVLWEQTAVVGKPKVPIHPQNSYATETPATDGERVVAYFGMIGAYCYDLDGKLLWSKDLGSFPMQMDWGSGSSPVLVDNLVIVQCDNDKSSFVVALDKRSGDEVWRVKRDEYSNWATPFVWKNDQRTELVTGGGAKMRSYDPATGKLLWELTASGRCSPSPVGTSSLLYVDSGDRLTGQRGVLVWQSNPAPAAIFRSRAIALLATLWPGALRCPVDASPPRLLPMAACISSSSKRESSAVSTHSAASNTIVSGCPAPRASPRRPGLPAATSIASIKAGRHLSSPQVPNSKCWPPTN